MTSPSAKPASAEAATDPHEVLRASWGFPAFARDFPRDPELDALVAAFAAGDYRSVRARAPALAQSATDDAVKHAAVELRARTEPDKTARLLFALAAALLVFLTAWWIAHDGPQPGPTAPVAKPPAAEHIK